MSEAKLLERVRGEFAEMPGLRLAPDQAARLWSLDVHVSVRVLEVLVDIGYLYKTADGAYLRVGVNG
jgi:hypothetical protein